MKTLALFFILAAVAPLANAEQGDAEDRAITAQMAREAQEAQAAQSLANSGYGDTGKMDVQSGLSKPKENSDTGDSSSGQ